MTPERWQQIREVYFAVSDAEEQDRPALLAKLTAGDADLAAAVDLLLISPPDGQAALDHPPLGESPLPFPPSTSLVLGELLAHRFEILSHLGSGGMGEVYEAEDRDLQTRVALKVIRPDVAETPGAVARFRREISLARQVTHRSICRVFDFFPSAKTSHGRTVDFLTMELLHGETLSKYITRQSPVPLSEAQPILNQLAAGLDAAHQARVLHRDLKGSNILLTTDAQGLRAVITDFGLARTHRTDDSPHSTSTVAAGTPLYMSPEQLEGGELTPASDLYSLGVLMYEMATGLPPYEGQSPLQVVVRRVKEERPPAPSSIYPAVDPGWEAAIMRCLAYNPNDRFRTATELAEAIGNPVPPAAVQKQSIAIPTRALQIAGILATLALAAYLWFRLSVPAPSQEAMRWYQQSVNAVNDGSFARASQLLERTLQVAPDFVSAHCRLAESYLELDRRDNAQAVLLKALSLRSRSKEESLLLEATKSLLSGSWDQVFAASKQRLASSDPQNATTARMDHARWLERAGQSEQAKEQYQIILKSDPSQPGALLRLASLQATGNQLADARTLFDKAESSFQALNNIEGLGEVALAKARLVNDVPEAIKLSASAEGLAKQAGSISLTVRAMLWRADRNTRLGQSEVARQLTLEAINAAEKSGLYAEAINAYIAMASVPYVQGKYEEAEQEFLKILALAKRYRTLRAEARTKVSLAMNYTYSQKARLALPLLDEALTFYQSSGMKLQQAHALGVKSDAFRLTGRYIESELALNAALEMTVGADARARILAKQATLAMESTRYDKAELIYKQLIAQSTASNNRVSAQGHRLDRSDALTGLGRFKEAQEELDSVKSEGPKSPRIAWQLEIALSDLDYQKGYFKNAVERLEMLRASTWKEGQIVLEREVRAQLCPKYVRGGKVEKGIAICEALLVEFAGRPASLITFHHALAQMYLLSHQAAKALTHANQSIIYSREMNSQSDIWYSLLLITLAQHQALDVEWKATRALARQALTTFEQQIGADALKLYLGRNATRQLWQSVEQL